jgi:hypothetical protein
MRVFRHMILHGVDIGFYMRVFRHTILHESSSKIPSVGSTLRFA